MNLCSVHLRLNEAPRQRSLCCQVAESGAQYFGAAVPIHVSRKVLLRWSRTWRCCARFLSLNANSPNSCPWYVKLVTQAANWCTWALLEACSLPEGSISSTLPVILYSLTISRILTPAGAGFLNFLPNFVAPVHSLIHEITRKQLLPLFNVDCIS
jgi:hypothetical protein